jgi:hypothetical protein
MDWFHRAAATAAPAPAPTPAPAPAAHEPTVLEHLTGGTRTAHQVADYFDAVRHEGISAGAGAVDRAGARRELAPMFTVRDQNAPRDELTGHTNTITPEEFEHVSRTYSNIRRASNPRTAEGQSHLRVDTDHVKPELQQAVLDDTMHDLANIMQTASGRTLVETLAEGTTSKEHPNAHDTVIYERGKTDNGEAWADHDTYNLGHGADASVSYASGPQGGIRFAGDDEWRNMRSDVTLYHELTHAYHLTGGTNAIGTIDNTDPTMSDVWAGDNGQDLDEAQALGLGKLRETEINENRYRAERNDVAASGVGVRQWMNDDLGNFIAGDAELSDRDHYVSSFAGP